MNTQKSVFNKISKIEKQVESQEVELSEVQKVEFALINEIEKNVEILQDNVNNGNSRGYGFVVDVGVAGILVTILDDFLDDLRQFFPVPGQRGNVGFAGGIMHLAAFFGHGSLPAFRCH